MNYELAKKLKDAGFPQFLEEVSPMNNMNRYLRSENNDDICFHPTLSELIEACGEQFESLGKSPIPEMMPFWASNGDNRVFGNTPEEVVANLWLELNKK